LTVVPAALSPDYAGKLGRLTREYARLTARCAGLPSLLGGGFLLLVALLEGVGHGRDFRLLGGFAPLPLRWAVLVATLPALWFWARHELGRWACARLGLVEEVPAASDRLRERLRLGVGRFLLPMLCLAGLIPLLKHPMSAKPLRVILLILLALGLHWAFPHLKQRFDRLVCILLTLAPAFLLSGLQMAAGDTLVAYPLIGIAAIFLGYKDFAGFRRVRRELTALEAIG